PSRVSGGHVVTERRSLVLTPLLLPQRYEVERSALGARSVWVGEMSGQGLQVMNNNLDWHAPVFQGVEEPLTPLPDVLIEDAPSAMPFALLALRYTALDEEVRRRPQSFHVANVLEELVASRPMTLTFDPLRQSGVIGAVALEGRVEGGLNPRFSLFVRPGSRALLSVEVEEYRFDFWNARRDPRLGRPGTLMIQRIRQRPEIPPLPLAGNARRVEITFTGARNTNLAGMLILPDGDGPFPCLVLHSLDGLMPRWEPGDALAEKGWAAFTYDKRGLGQSQGEFDRGPLDLLAEDAAAAGEMLRLRPEIDPRRIVLVGFGNGGYVGALAVSMTDAYAAAVLASGAYDGALFPGLVEAQIRGVLAAYHGWGPQEQQRYLTLSVTQWRQWLFEGREEVSFLGRRASLRALRTEANADLAQILPQARAPVLLVHGEQDHWVPVEGARALAQRLQAASVEQVTLETFADLGTDLGRADVALETGRMPLWAPVVDEAVFVWLNEALTSP
ncbi:MAG: alpha/beta hydrolase, partial [Chloroflexi bacterium]|nr:alpha/beta hydrolase [Chloroflexota bacterium]